MRRSTVRTAALSAAVAGVAGGALATGHVPGVEGLGPRLAQAQGHVQRTVYERPARLPAEDLPEWAREGGEQVTVVRPGRAAGSGVEGVRADVSVPAGFSPPASCTRLEHVGMPFDGGGEDWPDSTAPGQRCGRWSVVVADGHLYVWR